MNPSISQLSRRAWLRLASGASVVALTGGLPAAGGQTSQGSGRDRVSQAMFTNPLFAGEYADPTILRVGADFYLTHIPCAHVPRATWSAWQETDMSQFRVGDGELTMEAVGSSLNYFIRLRLHRACQLFDGTDQTSRQIALQVGYADPLVPRTPRERSFRWIPAIPMYYEQQ